MKKIGKNQKFNVSEQVQAIKKHRYSCSDRVCAEIILSTNPGLIKTIDGKHFCYFDQNWEIIGLPGFMNKARNLSEQIKLYGRDMIRQAGGEKEEMTDFLKLLIKKLTNVSTLSTIYKYLFSFKEISTTQQDWDNQNNIICTKDEVFLLNKDGIIRKRKTEDYLCLMYIDIETSNIDENIKCEKFDIFVNQIFGGNKKVIQYTWKFYGLCLLGDMIEQIITVFIGDGCNGKSTLASVMADVLGDYSTYLPFKTLEKTLTSSNVSNDIARLQNKRLAIASESSPGKPLNSQTLKQMTTQELMTARFLYGEFFSFQNSAKLIVSLNDLPELDDFSNGLSRRLRILPFNQSFLDNPNNNLYNELMSERVAIFFGGVRGLKNYYKEGLKQPEIMIDCHNELIGVQDPAERFIQESIVPKIDGKIPADELLERHKAWAKYRNLFPSNSNKLGRIMSKLFPKSRKKSFTTTYVGVAFADDLPARKKPYSNGINDLVSESIEEIF